MRYRVEWKYRNRPDSEWQVCLGYHNKRKAAESHAARIARWSDLAARIRPAD